MVQVAVFKLPLIVAVIVQVPPATPDTTPLASTVATLSSLLDHVMVPKAVAGDSVAVSCSLELEFMESVVVLSVIPVANAL